MAVYDYIDETGVIIPDAQDIRTGVQNEYLAAFGSDLNLAPNTPQGMLIDIETLSRVAVADNNAALANQINPNLAGGIFLDALLALLGAVRTPATHSTVVCTLTGVVGTSIPAGAQVSNAAGDLFEIISTTVIPAGGTITDVPFQSVETGEVPVDANTITVIVSNILGWESVNNPAIGTLGAATQSDAAARVFRLNTLGSQGTGLAAAMIAELYQVPGMASLSFLENATSSPATIQLIPMVANSIYVCVAGTATNADIGQAMTDTKSGGCAYNNGLGIPQSVNITNPISGQVIPVLFDYAAQVMIAMKVTITVFGVVQNVIQAIQDAVTNYAAGGVPGMAGFVVGANVSPFQIASAINAQVPGVFIDKVEIAVYFFTQQASLHSSTTVDALTYNTDILVGMGVQSNSLPNSFPANTTVATLVGATGITTDNAATVTDTEILRFTPASIVYQTTEIPIHIFQYAITTASLIQVIQS